MGLFSFLFGKRKYENLSATDFAEGIKAKNTVVLDVRRLGEFKSGHIAKAKNIDVTSMSFKSQVEKLDKEKVYYVYCRSGMRSARACQIMTSNGFEKVYNLTGGIMAWAGQGNQVVK